MKKLLIPILKSRESFAKNTISNVRALRICTPGGNLSYSIPVLKVQTYSIEEIFQKKLLFLIPFYIFCYENDLEKYNTNAEKMKELQKEYLMIRNRLEEVCAAGEISEYTKCTIIDMSNKVLAHIAAHYANVRKGVKAIMGGRVLDYEAKTILNTGMQKGMQKGIQTGKTEALLDLVRDGLLSPQEAAKRLKMPEDEFMKLI